MSEREKYFTVISSRTTSAFNERGRFREATVKVKIGDKEVHTAGEGNGPVSALGDAFRKALEPSFPELAKIKLVHFGVNIVNSDAGEDSSVEVVVVHQVVGDPSRQWMTKSVSTDMVDASEACIIKNFRLAIAAFRK